MDHRRSDANKKFEDQYQDLFGDVPDTLGSDSIEIHRESEYNFNQEFNFGRFREYI
jgi:hypothetical protein